MVIRIMEETEATAIRTRKAQKGFHCAVRDSRGWQEGDTALKEEILGGSQLRSSWGRVGKHQAAPSAAPHTQLQMSRKQGGPPAQGQGGEWHTDPSDAQCFRTQQGL